MPASLLRMTSRQDGDDEVRPCGLCLRCIAVCPSGALQYHDRMWSIDLRRCCYCRECAEVCPNTLIVGD